MASATAAKLARAPRPATPIYVNGARAAVTAIDRHGRIFVPMRGVFERLGASVSYVPPRTVIARKGGAEIARLALANRTALVDGRRVQLGSAPGNGSGTAS